MFGKVEITKPNQCLLAITIPLTKEDFFNSIELGINRDFIKAQFLARFPNYNHKSIWNDIYRHFLETINWQLNYIEEYGVVVVRDFSLLDLEKIEKYKVFTLYGHWTDIEAKVELFDGLYEAKEIVTRIPTNFSGIFDLTICKSTGLRNELKKKFYNQTISYNIEISLIASIILYRHTMSKMMEVDINYVDCLTNHIKNISNLEGI